MTITICQFDKNLQVPSKIMNFDVFFFSLEKSQLFMKIDQKSINFDGSISIILTNWKGGHDHPDADTLVVGFLLRARLRLLRALEAEI